MYRPLALACLLSAVSATAAAAPVVVTALFGIGLVGLGFARRKQ